MTQVVEDVKSRAQELLQAVQTAWVGDLRKDDRKWEPMAVYASGRRACVRAMALDLIAWDQKPDRDPPSLEKMRRGTEREKSVVARLIRVGQEASPRFSVIHEQYSEQLKDRRGRTIIRMKIDGRLEFETGEKPPFEIKRYHPLIADQIVTVEDFNRSPWTRHAPDQMLAYLLAHNAPWGVFLLETSGLPRLVPVFLDEHLERADSFLRDAETAMDAKERYPALREAALPPFVNDPAECRRCPHFGRSCNPPLNFGEGVQVLEDPELEALLKQREALSPQAAEYRKLDKAVKERFDGVELAIVGDFQVTGKPIERKGYAVKPGTYWDVRIERLNGNAPAASGAA